MSSASPKAGPLRKPLSCSPKNFPEQIRIGFVYHPMKLLILGLLAVALLAAASSRDCFDQWRSEAHERAREAREEARAAREQAREAREQVRELQNTQREQLRAMRDEIRAERDRIRREVREDLRDLHQDWSYTY